MLTRLPQRAGYHTKQWEERQLIPGFQESGEQCLLGALLVMLPYAQMLPTTPLALGWLGQLTGQGQIGFDLDRVGELEDQ